MHAEAEQRRNHCQTACARCEVEERASAKTAGSRDCRIALKRIEHKGDQSCAARGNHARQQADKDRRAGAKAPGESHCFIISAVRNGSDCIIQKTLLCPTRRQVFVVFVLWARGLIIYDVCRAMFEELPKGFARRFIELGGFECCGHLCQPCAPLSGTDLESRVRFAQTQPPASLSLFFVSAEKLNEESGEFFCGAPEAFTRE